MVVKGGYWMSDTGVDASVIESSHYTHLFCTFANLDTTTNQLEEISPECESFSGIVRQKNSSVKTLLSIGGGNSSSTDFNNMAGEPGSRTTFINSSINVARVNSFDGLDLDWEHQTTSEEMNNLATLITEWRDTINAEANNTGRPPLLLTAATAVNPNWNSGWPAEVMGRTLDFVNVMAYDFHWGENRSPGVTRSHAMLKNPPAWTSGSSGITAWIEAGVPANKLVLGVPFYGYTWKLENSNNHGILAPSVGVDPWVTEEGPGYNEIQTLINQEGMTVVFDDVYVTNYCYKGTTWINYDDTYTIAAKVSYCKDNNLLGYFAWSLNQDNYWALSTLASETWDA